MASFPSTARARSRKIAYKPVPSPAPIETTDDISESASQMTGKTLTDHVPIEWKPEVGRLMPLGVGWFLEWVWNITLTLAPVAFLCEFIASFVPLFFPIDHGLILT